MESSTSAGRPSYLGGYTPGYLLHYLFLQLLSFFSSSLIEQDHGGFEDVYAYARLPQTDFRCQKCRFDSASLWSHAREQMRRQPNKRCPWLSSRGDISISGQQDITPAAPLTVENDGGNHLSMLQGHIWLRIFDHLSDQDLINLGAAAPSPVGAALCRFSVPQRRELLCFFSRKTFKEAVLGVGVRLVQATPRGKVTLHAEAFDLLSFEAFEHHHVRRGVCGEAFTHFLPLALDDEHFTRAMPALKSFLMDGRLGGDISLNGFLHVIPKIMNSMIVDMMKVCETHTGTILQASEKTFKGYCLLFHLLSKLSEKGDLKAKAKGRMELLLCNEGKECNKSNLPDLGEFVALLPLALDEGYDWLKLSKALVKELFTRNVLWVLKATPRHAWGRRDELLINLDHAFSATKVGLRLMMLQANFMRALVECRSTLSERYGFPTDAMAKQLVGLVKKIYALEDENGGHGYEAWRGFFTILNYSPIPTEVQLQEMLRKSVKESERKGYHR